MFNGVPAVRGVQAAVPKGEIPGPQLRMVPPPGRDIDQAAGPDSENGTGVLLPRRSKEQAFARRVAKFIETYSLFEPDFRGKIIDRLRDPFAHDLPKELCRPSLRDLALYQGVLALFQNGPEVDRKFARYVIESHLLGFGAQWEVQHTLRALLMSGAELSSKKNRYLISLWMERTDVFGPADLDCLFFMAQQGLEIVGSERSRSPIKAKPTWGPQIDVCLMGAINGHSQEYVAQFLALSSQADTPPAVRVRPTDWTSLAIGDRADLLIEYSNRQQQQSGQAGATSRPLQFLDAVVDALRSLGLRSPEIVIDRKEDPVPRWTITHRGWPRR